MSSNYEGLGNALRIAREAAGFGVREAARQVEVSPSHLSRLESGQRNSSLEVLERLAAIYKTTVDNLALPEPRDYFIRKLGVSADDAGALARLVAAFVSEKSKEVKNAKDD